MGEFEDLNRKTGAIAQLRALNGKAWAALGCGVIVLLLIVAALTGTKTTTGTSTAAASQPLPMTPTGSYTVGDSYYAGMLPMPNYVGWTLQAAVNDLAQRGITVAITNPAAASANIIQQNPYPGTRISPATANVIQFMVPATLPTTTTVPPTTTTSAVPSQTDVDVDVDRDHNLPDGALTGGYCRHKWWC